MVPNKNAAQKWFDAGAAEAEKGRNLWKKMRGHVIDAGFYFRRAREAYGNGDWGLFLETQAHRMKPRTVQLYVQLSEAALEWVREMQPQIAANKLEAAAREVMMLSPKPLIALLRDLREMRPFGEYDAIRYATRKQLGEGQLELDFSKALASFDALEHCDEANFTLLVPEGKSEAEAWMEIKSRCERIALKAGAWLEKSKTVDV